MNESTKQAYLDKSNAQLKEWGLKIEVIKAKMEHGSAEARIQFHRQMDTWQEKESALKVKLEEFRNATADNFEVAKAGAQSVWNEVTTLMSSIKDSDKKTD